jgi:hypothetical protein
MLHVPEALTVFAAHAEIKFLDVLILCQRGRFAVHDYPAGLENIAVLGETQSHVRVLLCKQKCNPFLLIQAGNDLENLLHQLRRQTHGRFVQKNDGRTRHERPPQRGHLLLTAGGVTGL